MTSCTKRKKSGTCTLFKTHLLAIICHHKRKESLQRLFVPARNALTMTNAAIR